LELGGVHAIGEPQDREYGPGTEGRAAAELGLTKRFGLQIEGGSLWLAHTNPPMDPSIADHSDGAALFAMAGARLRPLFDVAGPWVDANVGYVRTGTLARVGFDAHVGYDWRVGDGRWDLGPYAGYFQVLQPGNTLRPQDAHVLSIGIHVALGAARTPVPVATPLPPVVFPEFQPQLPSDRDGDGIIDAQDACPDVPGVASEDPALNGCPPRPAAVRIVDDRIEYGEIVLFETDEAEVQDGAIPILRDLAKFIADKPQIEEVEIIGHADERGTEDYNLRLSRARAEAVRATLVSFGVDETRLTTKGLGFRHPLAHGHFEDDWRQNRRVEFRISKVRAGASNPPTMPPSGTQGAQP